MTTDEELVRRWQDGDSAAGEQLFARWFRSVYRFFATKVGDAAEDLTQDAFAACVKGRDRFRFEAQFRTYLFATARRLLARHYERRNARGLVQFDTDTAASLDPTPSTHARAREEEQLYLAALRALPLDYQIALELHLWEGLPGPALAEVLEVPEGTIRSRLRRGRLQFEAKLRELALDPRVLKSTLTRLDDWAQRVGEIARER